MNNSKLKRIGAACISAAMLMGLAGCQVAIPEESGDNKSGTTESQAVDFSKISAKDDFFGYVNGEALATADIENDYQNIGTIGAVNEEVFNILSAKIKEIVNSDTDYEYGSKEWIIKHLYEECYETFDDEYMKAYYEKQFPEVEETLEKIKNASTSEELSELLAENNVGIVPRITVDVNALDPSNFCYKAVLYKSILGVSFDEINDDCNNIVENKDSYIAVFKALGDSKEDAADKVLDIQYLALNFCWSTEADIVGKFKDNDDVFTFVSNSELAEIFTNFDYKKIEETYGIDNPFGGWYCYSVDQLKGINECYNAENLEALRNMAIAEYCMANADVLALKYKDLSSGFFFSGDKELATINKLLMDAHYSHFFEMVYVEEVYDEEADKMLRDMCDDVIEGYREIIEQASWLSEDTRIALIEKLDNIIVLTAKDIDVNEIDTDFADCLSGDYFETIENIKELEAKRTKQEVLDGASRTKIFMPMHEVNACYNNYFNNITITLAIQSYPFFSKDESYAFNLAGLGGTITHEIGHAFDSNGLNYDMNGVYNPSWISSEDVKTLEARNQEAINYFETAFSIYNIYYVDGAQTLGENYADLGGLEVCMLLLDGEDEYKEFFENYAISWSEITTVNDLKNQLKYDVHSPALLRTNAILACLDEFYETYDVKEGDGMYISPENRVSRWY